MPPLNFDVNRVSAFRHSSEGWIVTAEPVPDLIRECRNEHSRSEWPEGHAAEPVLDLIQEAARNPVLSLIYKARIKNWIPASA